jgi:hypothetical protein
MQATLIAKLIQQTVQGITLLMHGLQFLMSMGHESTGLGMQWNNSCEGQEQISCFGTAITKRSLIY